MPDNPVPSAAPDAPPAATGTGGAPAASTLDSEVEAEAEAEAESDAAAAAGRQGVDGQATVATSRKKQRAKSRNRALAEWAIAIGLAVMAAFVIKTFLIQAFVIPSGSMEHTLEIHDRVLVSKFAYRISDIGRGDVIVFKNPKRQPGEPAQLIKRVVATEGDVIEAVGGKLQVNGEVVDEPYLAPGTPTRDLPRQTVPAGHVFVLGDNRGNSKDSRFIGPIDNDDVIGKAFFRLWPLSRLGGL